MEIKAVTLTCFIVYWKFVLHIDHPITLPFPIVHLTKSLYLRVKAALNWVEQVHLNCPWLFEVEYTVGVFNAADGLLLLFLMGSLHQEIKSTS